jgi:hypothetical protein
MGVFYILIDWVSGLASYLFRCPESEPSAGGEAGGADSDAGGLEEPD